MLGNNELAPDVEDRETLKLGAGMADLPSYQVVNENQGGEAEGGVLVHGFVVPDLGQSYFANSIAI